MQGEATKHAVLGSSRLSSPLRLDSVGQEARIANKTDFLDFEGLLQFNKPGFFPCTFQPPCSRLFMEKFLKCASVFLGRISSRRKHRQGFQQQDQFGETERAQNGAGIFSKPINAHLSKKEGKTMKKSLIPNAALHRIALALACLGIIAACASLETPSKPAAVPEVRPGILAGYLPPKALPNSLALLSPPPDTGLQGGSCCAGSPAAYRSVTDQQSACSQTPRTSLALHSSLRSWAAAERRPYYYNCKSLVEERQEHGLPLTIRKDSCRTFDLKINISKACSGSNSVLKS